MSIQRFKVTPTVSTSPAYTANDVVGGRLQFTGFHKGTLHAITITDDAAQNVDYVLVFFESAPTDITDNATFDIADADLPKIIYWVSLDATTYRKAFTDNSIHIRTGLNVPLIGQGDIYAFLYTTGTPTYADPNDITVTIQLETETPWSN